MLNPKRDKHEGECRGRAGKRPAATVCPFGVEGKT